MIRYVSRPFENVCRHVLLVGVDVLCDHTAGAAELGHRSQLPIIRKLLHQDAVHLLADPPVSAVDEVLDHLLVRLALVQHHGTEVPERIVAVPGHIAPNGLRL